MTDDDPIGALVQHLTAGEAPPLAWVVHWSSGSLDPVAAAWRTSRSPRAMRRLLAIAGPRWDAAFRDADALRIERTTLREGTLGFTLVSSFDGELQRWEASAHGSTRELSNELDQRLADAIRRVVPAPPRLAELLRSVPTRT